MPPKHSAACAILTGTQLVLAGLQIEQVAKHQAFRGKLIAITAKRNKVWLCQVAGDDAIT